jgi:LPS export ABC transporter protein LptC
LIKKAFFIFILFLFFSENIFAQENYITLNNIVHNISKDKKLIYKIEAKKGFIRDLSSKNLKLKDIKLTWYEDDNIKITAVSKEGFFDKDSGNINLKNQIKAYNEVYTITCDELQYDNKVKNVFFNGNVKIKSDKMVVSSKKGSYDTIKRALFLNENVKGILNED